MVGASVHFRAQSGVLQDVGWEIMCPFSCDEVQREQEIGFACERGFFARSNPNSQYYYSKGQTARWQIREEKSGQNTRQWGWERAD